MGLLYPCSLPISLFPPNLCNDYMRIPKPHEIGLPEQFENWRPAQEEALRILLTSTKRVRTLSMPTGNGKSIVAVAYALITKQPTVFVTSSRGLQNQYTELFGSIGMVDIRGRRNYTCDMKPEYTCEEGHAARCPNKGTVMCSSSRAEMLAATSFLVTTNYDKWTSSRKFGKGMQHFTQAVFDESHSAPDALARAMQVVLHHKEIEETLGINFLTDPEALSMVEWKSWASEARAAAELKMLQARARMAGILDPKPSWVRHYTHMRLLTKRLATLALARATDWVVEEVKEGFQFDPVRPGRYTESALFLKVPSIVCMSATIRPKTMYMLGQSKDSFEYREFDSEFDPKRCPIYYIPVMRVDRNADNYSQLWLKLDQIAAKRTDRKGIVQTISFARRDEVMRASRFSGSMLINPQGEAPTEMIEQFRGCGPGTILVSPSVAEGYDFKGKDAEWQFTCKIPFPSPSKILKARTEDDKEYPYYIAMNKLVQIFGRIMRDKKDRGENFIGDEHLDWFLPRYSHLAPKSFKQFFKRVEFVPPPPPRL